MEQVRNVRLDHICESILDERAAKNAATTEEQGLIATALQEMQKKNVTVYKHGGVELVRVPGADKLRVRLSKEDGDADVAGGATTSGGEDVPPNEPEFEDERGTTH